MYECYMGVYKCRMGVYEGVVCIGVGVYECCMVVWGTVGVYEGVICICVSILVLCTNTCMLLINTYINNYILSLILASRQNRRSW